MQTDAIRKNLPKTIIPPSFCNSACYASGLIILLLNKLRHSIIGYRTPRTFSVADFTRAIQYDLNVVDGWITTLKEYSSGVITSLKEKTILELGPGADLGTGLIILSKGARKYHAIDVNELAKSVPILFYEKLFSHIGHDLSAERIDVDELLSQLTSTLSKNNDRLNYICRKDFDMSVFNGEDIDIVFSQAAFEHFDDMEKTAAQLSKVVKRNTILIAEIDLKTHTRWIRDMDPLNIYRYSDFLYNLFKFRGSPNRLRPFHYAGVFQRNGWSNIQIRPLTVLKDDYIKRTSGSLHKKFKDSVNQMHILSFMLCATKH